MPRRPSLPTPWTPVRMAPAVFALAFAALALTGCAGRKTGPADAQAPGTAPAVKAPHCAGGLVKDDGDLESGYSFVPSAKMGIYLQEIHSEELPNRQLDSVCVCWLRTRDDADIDFDLVFYAKEQGLPAEMPYAIIRDAALAVPKGKEANGAFYDIEVPEIVVPEGVSYVGVTWDPSVDRFFFVCADHGPGVKVTPGFQRDDRSKGWEPVVGSADPIFQNHRAAMIRVLAAPAPPPAAPPPKKGG